MDRPMALTLSPATTDFASTTTPVESWNFDAAQKFLELCNHSIRSTFNTAAAMASSSQTILHKKLQ
jgi:hypothetical protein